MCKINRTLVFRDRSGGSISEELVLKLEPESDEASRPNYQEGWGTEELIKSPLQVLTARPSRGDLYRTNSHLKYGHFED